MCARQIRRIGENQIKTSAPHGREQIAPDSPHPHSVEPAIDSSRKHRSPGNVHGGHAARPGETRRDRQHPAAGADVQHPRTCTSGLVLQLLGKHQAVTMGFEDAWNPQQPHVLTAPIPVAIEANVSPQNPHWPPSPGELRAAFDNATPYTVGIEDEVMLLAPDTFELCPAGPEVLGLLSGDPRFKLELPASQIEITTPPCPHVGEAAATLLDARSTLADAATGIVRPAAAGVHPFSPGIGELNRTPAYKATIRDYGQVARRQLVCALQVHVAAGDGDRSLAVYNAARSYLPLIAALAANAPFYEGDDTGLASVRPKLGQLLPRQGIPPVIDSWEAYAEILRWGFATGAFATARTWWWELRLHPTFGTLEFRVPDGQTTVKDAAAIAAVAQALVAWLGERHDPDEQLAVDPSWQIDENRWSACRYGIEGEMVDLKTMTQRPSRTLILELLDSLAPLATRLNSRPALEHARTMARVNGAVAQRQVAANGGPRAVAAWLAERFLEPVS